MAIQITFKSGAQGGGSGGSPVQSDDFTDAAAASADFSSTKGIQNGLLVVPNPVNVDGAVDGPAAYSVSEISGISTISAVTFGVVTA